MTRLKGGLQKALIPLLALITALLFGAIVIILTDFESLAKLGTDPLGSHRRGGRRGGGGLRGDAGRRVRGSRAAS